MKVYELISKPSAWIQDQYWGHRMPSGRINYEAQNDPNCWCLSGALRTKHTKEGDPEGTDWRAVERDAKRLTGVIKRRYPEVWDEFDRTLIVYSDFDFEDFIVFWNDQRGREWSEVHSVAKEADV